MQLLAAKFAQIATAIDTTNAQIAALQAKLSELQEHQQQLLSVEQACQSALSQVDQALMMLHHVDPTEIATFFRCTGSQVCHRRDRHSVPSRHCTDTTDRAGAFRTNCTGTISHARD